MRDFVYSPPLCCALTSSCTTKYDVDSVPTKPKTNSGVFVICTHGIQVILTASSLRRSCEGASVPLKSTLSNLSCNYPFHHFSPNHALIILWSSFPAAVVSVSCILDWSYPGDHESPALTVFPPFMWICSASTPPKCPVVVKLWAPYSEMFWRQSTLTPTRTHSGPSHYTTDNAFARYAHSVFAVAWQCSAPDNCSTACLFGDFITTECCIPF